MGWGHGRYGNLRLRCCHGRWTELCLWDSAFLQVRESREPATDSQTLVPSSPLTNTYMVKYALGMWSLRFRVLSLQALWTKGRDSEVHRFNLCDAEGVLTSRQIGKEATGKQEDSPLPAASSPRMRLGGILSFAGRVSGLGCPKLFLDMFQLAWSYRSTSSLFVYDD